MVKGTDILVALSVFRIRAENSGSGACFYARVLV